MKFLYILFLLLAGLGCSACVHHENYIRITEPKNARFPLYTVNPEPVEGTFVYREDPVWIDDTFSINEKGEIKAALAEWNYALNGYRKFIVVDDKWDTNDRTPVDFSNRSYLGLEIVAVGDADVPPTDDGDNHGVLAWVPGLYNHRLYIVEDRIGTRNLKSIVLHEVGHVLGMDHIAITESLMNASYQHGSSCIDKVTIMLLGSDASDGDYDYHNMNWCSYPR